MPKASLIFTNFVSGEYSPRQEGRIDLAGYYNSCRVLENMIIAPQGGVERAPGTVFCAKAKTAAKKVRLIDFNMSLYNSSEFVLELGHNYVRFYKDHAYKHEIATSYTEADLFEVKYVQYENVMYLVHPSYPLYKLVKTAAGDTSWTLSTPTLTGGAAAGINDATDHYATAVAIHEQRLILAGTNAKPQKVWGSKNAEAFEDFTTGANDSDAFAFNMGMENSFHIKSLVSKENIHIFSNIGEIIFTGIDGPPITPTSFHFESQSNYGSKDMQALKTGENMVYVQGAGKKLREYYYNRDTDIHISPDLTIRADHITGDGITQMALQTNPDLILWCIRSDGQLIGLTYEKSIGVFGWHRHITGNDDVIESVIVIRTASGEDEIWISVLRDASSDGKRYLEYFKPRDFGDDQKDCFFVHSGVTLDKGAAKDITDISADKIDRGDCESTTPPMIFDETVPRLLNATFARDAAEKHGGTYSYKFTKTIAKGTAAHVYLVDKQTPTDMHGMIAGHTYTKTLWIKVPSASGIALNEINLKILDYDSGWVGLSVNPTSFDIWQKISITRTLRLSATGAQIELYIFQTAENNEYFYIDDIDLLDHDSLIVTSAGHGFENDYLVKITGVVGMTELNDKEYMVKNKADNTFQLYLVDGSDGVDGTDFTAYTSGGLVERVTKTVSGLDHLEDETVAILADGGTHPDKTVSSGAVTLDNYFNTVHVGLSYISKLKPMRIEAGAATGTAQGKLKKITQLCIRFYKSLLCKFGPDEDHLETIVFRKTTDVMGSPPALFSGDKVRPFPGGWTREGNIMIIQDQPLPMTILALMPVVYTND